MKIATTFGDPQAVSKRRCDALVASVATPPSFLADLVIATVLPKKNPTGPLLVVRSGRWLEYQAPVTAVNRIRLVAWHPDEDVAWDIVSWFHGRLLAFPGDEDVVSFRYDDGPQKGTDPDFDSPIAACTIAVRMRPARIV